ncbi:MAG: type II toxin-antitoxin system PemK/MazF family toxin [archaeon]
MERLVKGEVVAVPFPYSDLSQTKRRPALVLQTVEGNDIILCAITSQETKGVNVIGLDDSEFSEGGLKKSSFIRPDKLFTCDRSIVEYSIGSLKKSKMLVITKKVCAILEQ